MDECLAYLGQAEKESSSFYVFAVLALNTGAGVGDLIALGMNDEEPEPKDLHQSATTPVVFQYLG